MPRFDPKLKEAKSQGIVTELLEQPAATTAPAAKIGRPKGKPKTKKTFYLTDGENLLQEIKLTFAKEHNLLFTDESELADLAMALLQKVVHNPDKVQEAIHLYYSEIKEQKGKKA